MTKLLSVIDYNNIINVIKNILFCFDSGLYFIFNSWENKIIVLIFISSNLCIVQLLYFFKIPEAKLKA